MILRRLFTITILLTSTIWSQAQQINPVPDYVFRNQMSVGRNAVTDTGAYFSIGPRYGAVKGFMPPIVVDTASFSGSKRNGLLIFSIQKNKFLYWDSVGVKWAEMAGTGGNAITGSGVAGYMPEFTTTTNLDTTRLYHSAGRFAIGSTTTTNGVFNVYGGQSYFDTSLKVGNQTFFVDESKNEVYINTTIDSGNYALQVSGQSFFNGDLYLHSAFGQSNKLQFRVNAAPSTEAFEIKQGYTGSGDQIAWINNKANASIYFGTNDSFRVVINARGDLLVGSTQVDNGNYALQVQNNMIVLDNVVLSSLSGETLIATQTDNGDYKLQVNGNIYGNANLILAGTSSNLGINTASTSAKIDIVGSANATTNETLLELNHSTTGTFNGSSTKRGYYVSPVSVTSTLDIVNSVRNFESGDVLLDAAVNRYVYASFYNMKLGKFQTDGSAGIPTSHYQIFLDSMKSNESDVTMHGIYISNIQGGQSGGSYGIHSNVTSGTGTARFNAYMAGTAPNYFNGEVYMGSTSDAGAYQLQVTGAIYNTTTITTGAPTSGSAKPWRLGEAATVSPTSPNRTIRVEIDGVVYYIHAKTTND